MEILAAVLATYGVSGLLLEESGLLTVTVLGVTLGNSRIASLTELRRFKEFITVLLVSGVFVILTATLDLDALRALASRDAWFLADQGIADGHRLVPLTFAVVVATVLLHGFTLNPLARLLGLGAIGPQGVLIVGGSPWSTAFAEQLHAIELPVMLVDRNWGHLKDARGEDLRSLAVTLGGRPLLNEVGGYHTLNSRLAAGWRFRKTTLTADFDAAALRHELGEEGRPMLARRGNRILWLTGAEPPRLETGDLVLSFAPDDRNHTDPG